MNAFRESSFDMFMRNENSKWRTGQEIAIWWLTGVALNCYTKLTTLFACKFPHLSNYEIKILKQNFILTILLYATKKNAL